MHCFYFTSKVGIDIFHVMMSHITAQFMKANHAEVNGASIFIQAQDMQITKSNLNDALLTLNDALPQTWIKWI